MKKIGKMTKKKIQKTFEKIENKLKKLEKI